MRPGSCPSTPSTPRLGVDQEPFCYDGPVMDPMCVDSVRTGAVMGLKACVSGSPQRDCKRTPSLLPRALKHGAGSVGPGLHENNSILGELTELWVHDSSVLTLRVTALRTVPNAPITSATARASDPLPRGSRMRTPRRSLKASDSIAHGRTPLVHHMLRAPNCAFPGCLLTLWERAPEH
eukprot:466688-Prymnesium_polylepis.1